MSGMAYDYHERADWSRVSVCAGYPAVYCPDHPRSWASGYIHAHVIVAESCVGRLLEPTECVHHRDGIRHNNDPSNLVVLSRLAHVRGHAKRAKPRRFTCSGCGKRFTRAGHRTLNQRNGLRPFCSRQCYYGHHKKRLDTVAA